MRYSSLQPVGEGRYLGAAACPMPTIPAGSLYNGEVRGSLGVTRIPAPRPDLDRGHASQAMAGTFTSAYAPDYWRPIIYYEAGDGNGTHEHCPVRREADNRLPIPAGRVGAYITSAVQFRPIIGGSRQIFQPQVVPVWMARGGGSG